MLILYIYGYTRNLPLITQVCKVLDMYKIEIIIYGTIMSSLEQYLFCKVISYIRRYTLSHISFVKLIKYQ